LVVVGLGEELKSFCWEIGLLANGLFDKIFWVLWGVGRSRGEELV
jgi:hypothetical protein